MVYLIQHKDDSNTLYCFENPDTDIERNTIRNPDNPTISKLVWLIPHTGIILEPDTIIEEMSDCNSTEINIREEVNGYKNQKEAEFNYEDNEPNEEYNKVWVDKFYYIGVKQPSQIFYKGDVKVYSVESPYCIKMFENEQTLEIKGIKMCMAVFIEDGINLLGFHYVTGNISELDCKSENLKIMQLINLLRLNNMNNTNSKLVFYKRVQPLYVLKQKNEMELLALKLDFDKYEVYTGYDGSVLYNRLNDYPKRVVRLTDAGAVSKKETKSEE